jgi:hypothetical protein
MGLVLHAVSRKKQVIVQADNLKTVWNFKRGTMAASVFSRK